LATFTIVAQRLSNDGHRGFVFALAHAPSRRHAIPEQRAGHPSR
jgi:hypothetical protein